MPNHKAIYSRQADQYEKLVGCEDYQQNILKTLLQVAPLHGKDVVELGAGTGRLTCLLAPIARSLHAFDASRHMLDVTTQKLQKSGLRNWQTGISDHCNLPVANRMKDIAIAGWSICYLVDLDKKDWPVKVNRALGEMRRVVRPGGTVILLETLGAGNKTPIVPETMTAYYQILKEKGFASTWIRTDFQFETAEEAQRLIRFFFGDETVKKIRAGRGITLPECTGIWWLNILEE